MIDPEEKIPSHEDIARRAYELYLESGQQDGHAEEHWLIAEEELTRELGANGSAPLRSKAVGYGSRADD
jgi:Protein of unknown function (DUF2934)